MSVRQLERTLTSALGDAAADARARIHVTPQSDPIDDAQRVEDAAVAVEQLNAAGRRRRQAHEALERLRHGRYGICTTCGDAIGDARLAALPAATRCIGCQSRHEQAGRDHGVAAGGSIRDWLDAA